MYGLLFTYIWLKCMVNVGKYTIHGSYGTWYRYVWHMKNKYMLLILNNPLSIWVGKRIQVALCVTTSWGFWLVANQDTGTRWSQSSTLVAHLGSRSWWAQVVLYSYILSLCVDGFPGFSRTKNPGKSQQKVVCWRETGAWNSGGMAHFWGIYIYINYKLRIYLLGGANESRERQAWTASLLPRQHLEPRNCGTSPHLHFWAKAHHSGPNGAIEDGMHHL